MRVKLDENVSAVASALFTESGHETHTVTDEGLNGVDDEQLFAVCVRKDRLLITFDVGFGDVRAHPPGTHAGIILMRLRDQQPAVTLDVLRRVLAAHDLASFAGALVVVSDDHVRIRRA